MIVCSMPVLDNPKHELFAQALAEGMTQIEAYAQVGYEPNESHASRLARNGKVSERVFEIQGEAAVRAGVNVARFTKDLMRLAMNAEKAGERGIAGAQLMNAAKLNGLIIDKQQVKTEEDMDADDLRANIRSEIAALGVDVETLAPKGNGRTS